LLYKNILPDPCNDSFWSTTTQHEYVYCTSSHCTSDLGYSSVLTNHRCGKFKFVTFQSNLGLVSGLILQSVTGLRWNHYAQINCTMWTDGRLYLALVWLRGFFVCSRDTTVFKLTSSLCVCLCLSVCVCVTLEFITWPYLCQSTFIALYDYYSY